MKSYKETVLFNLTKWRKDEKIKLLKLRHPTKVKADSMGLRMGLEFCISNLLLVEVHAAGAWILTHLGSKTLQGINREI